VMASGRSGKILLVPSEPKADLEAELETTG